MLAQGWSSTYPSVSNLLRKLSRKSRSEETRRTYLATIAKICNFLGMSPDDMLNVNLKMVEDALQSYCDMLDKQGYSRKYINNIVQRARL